MVYSWNITIQYWMKKYVYMRLVSKGENPPIWKFFIVFVISAFWHGFYPCYYFFFLIVGLYLFVVGEFKNIYSHKITFISPFGQKCLTFIVINIIDAYIGSSFMMFNPNVINQVVEFLNNSKFDHGADTEAEIEN